MAFARACAFVTVLNMLICNCVEFTSKRNVFVELQYFSNATNSGWMKYTVHVWVDQSQYLLVMLCSCYVRGMFLQVC